MALVGVAVFAVFERNGAAESQSASPAPSARSTLLAGSTTSKIAFSVEGRGVGGDAGGTFTLIGAVSDSGTSHIIGNTSSARPLLGERVFKERGQGPGELHGRKGDLSFWWSGSFVSVNPTTVVTTGVWRVRSGTGIYKTWKGGGTLVSVGHHAPSADSHTPSGVGTDEARFEGRVKR